MKKLIIIAVATLSVASFSSCKKCITCTRAVDNQSTGEVCNKKKEIDAMEEKFTSAEYQYTCTRK